MNKITCPRCGRKAATKLIPLSCTSRGVYVCTDCYTYLTESDAAYERFVLLERTKSKKKEESEDQNMTNKQGRPSSWTEEEVKDLIAMHENGVRTSEMARRLGRSDGAVSGKLWQLRDQGRLPNREEVDDAEPVGTGADASPKAPTEEKGELNPLEEEMANTITGQREEIEKLTARIAELEASNEALEKENDELLEKGIELHNRASDLDRELQSTRKALAETEQQFDEYRKLEHAGADAILARYEKELERTEAEISRLTRALERANRIALGVVERFALGDVS